MSGFMTIGHTVAASALCLALSASAAHANTGAVFRDVLKPHGHARTSREKLSDGVELTGSAPSGWKVTFDPKTVDRIAPNDNKEVQALITPTDKAIAGDYVTTVRASARGESASSNFRVTVTTSTMWGIAGVGIIGVALLVMVGAVARFGRR